MDDAPTGLCNDLKTAVAFLLTINPVPMNRKDKLLVAEIYATTAEENETPRKKIRHREGRNVGT